MNTQKIQLKIVLHSATDTTCKRYFVVVEYELSNEHLRDMLVIRETRVRVGKNVYKVTFLDCDYDSINGIICAHSRMTHSTSVRGYMQMLNDDGWKEVEEPKRQSIVTSFGR